MPFWYKWIKKNKKAYLRCIQVRTSWTNSSPWAWILSQVSWRLSVPWWMKKKSKELIKYVSLESLQQGSEWLCRSNVHWFSCCCWMCGVLCCVAAGKTTPEGFHCAKVNMSAVSSLAGTRGDRPEIRAGVALSAWVVVDCAEVQNALKQTQASKRDGYGNRLA